MLYIELISIFRNYCAKQFLNNKKKNTNIYINIFGCIITIACIVALLDYMKKNKKTRINPEFTHVKFQNRKRKTFKELMNNLIDTKYYVKHKNEAIMKQFYK